MDRDSIKVLTSLLEESYAYEDYIVGKLEEALIYIDNIESELRRAQETCMPSNLREDYNT